VKHQASRFKINLYLINLNKEKMEWPATIMYKHFLVNLVSLEI